MSDNQHPESIFAEARQLSDAAEREAYLEQACGDDPSLRHFVEALLKADADDDGVLAETEDADAPGGEIERIFAMQKRWRKLAATASDTIERLKKRGERPRYKIVGEFARGGMGAILRVWDRDLRRTLAMKVVLGQGEPQQGDTPPVDERTLGRFVDEAQITGQLDHPGIVPVHEIGIDKDGQVFFTMRLVQGIDLRKVFEQLREGEADWTQTRVLGVILKVCEAMAYAHSKGVIHRDLKPANIMVGRFGEVYVMDWGLAYIRGTSDSKDVRIQPPDASLISRVLTDRREGLPADSPLLTMDGDVVGTPAYMSPEQACGDTAAMGAESDVYSLGAVLYELLVGHMPYVPPNAKINAYALWALMQIEPPPPAAKLAPKAPEELVAICEKAMARERGERYQDMGAMADDLRAFVEGRVVGAHRTGAVIEFKKWVARNRGLAMASLAAMVIAVAGLSVTLYVLSRGKAELMEQNGVLELARQEAADHLAVALIETRKAEREREHAQVARSLRLVDIAQRKNDEHDHGTALLLALEAAPLDLDDADRRIVQEVHGELFSALDGLREVRGYQHDAGQSIGVRVGPNEERFVLQPKLDPAVLLDRDGDVVATLGGPTHVAKHVAFAADGQRIATASEDGTARVWDNDGRELLVLPCNLLSEAGVRHVAFSPDGSRIVTSGTDGVARIWSREGEELSALRKHGTAVQSAGFGPDGTRLFTIADRETKLWLADGTEVGSMATRRAYQSAPWFTGDGKWLLVSGMEGPCLWATDGSRCLKLDLPPAFMDPPVWGVNLAMDPQGTRIVGWRERHVRIWETSGVVVGDYEVEPAPTERVQVFCLAYSDDGRQIALGLGSGDGVLLDCDGKELARLPGKPRDNRMPNIWHVDFRGDGELIAMSGAHQVTLWDGAGRKHLVLKGHDAPHLSYFTPDGLGVLSTTETGAKLWSLESVVGRWHRENGKPLKLDRNGNEIFGSSDFAEAVELGHRVAPRVLTPKERELYYLGASRGARLPRSERRKKRDFMKEISPSRRVEEADGR
ncbi:MAG: tRNA A-37 threonylcarbamoyl transferase component Bud32 [Planctomycetota bacterium]|jgi:tRNA A-37 threonylcarbamoyl transferase component Bud32